MATNEKVHKQCGGCDALCCKYIGVPLDDPETRGDFDDLIWFLHHEGMSIYVDEGDWYLNIHTRCKQLDESNRCTIYDNRPRICRKHNLDECEFDGRPYDFEMQFNTAEEMEAYAKKFLRKKYSKKKRRRRKKR